MDNGDDCAKDNEAAPKEDPDAAAEEDVDDLEAAGG